MLNDLLSDKTTKKLTHYKRRAEEIESELRLQREQNQQKLLEFRESLQNRLNQVQHKKKQLQKQKQEQLQLKVWSAVLFHLLSLLSLLSLLYGFFPE